MSETSMIEIVASPVRTIRSAIVRKRIMGEKIAVHMKQINQNLATLKSNESSLTSRNYQSISPLLDKVKPITINLGNTTPILETSKKLTATMYALANSEELNGLHSEVKLKIPNLDNLVREINYFLKTGNISALQVKSTKINSQFKKMHHVLRSKQLAMENEEIKITSLLIRDSLKEIGFESIKQIRSKSGSIILRAVDQKSTSMFAEINAREGIRIDTKGFEGEECTKAVNALVDKLKEKGIEARKKDQVFHNKSEGGELVKAAEPHFNTLETPPVPPHQDEAERRRRIQLSKKRQKVNKNI